MPASPRDSVSCGRPTWRTRAGPWQSCTPISMARSSPWTWIEMTLRSMRHVPAGVLLVLLGLLTWVTWSDVDPAPVRVSDRVDGLRSITWAGAVSPDGRLAVRITYDLGDDQQRQLSV